MIDFLNEFWWLSIILFAVLFLVNHYMTVVTARLYKAYASQYESFQHGIEMNPNFEKETANFQWFTHKHILVLIGDIGALSVIHFLGWVAIFEFLIGAFLLSWLDINLVNIQNILYLRAIRKPGSLTGKTESSYWLMQRHLASRKITQAVLLSIAALAIMRPFFWGGVACLLVQGFRHLKLANRNFTHQTNIATVQKTADKPATVQGLVAKNKVDKRSSDASDQQRESLLQTNLIVICPACKTRVLPKADGTCPSCQAEIPAKSIVKIKATP